MAAAPLRVLVAEDDPDTLAFYRDALARLGYQALAVRDGNELVERARQAPPDLILTDILMPGLDGIRAAAAVCHEEGPVPILLVSAYHGEQLVEEALRASVVSYLLKPVAEEQLGPAIEVALARSAAQRQVLGEAADAGQAAEDLKAVERAKLELMRCLGMQEPEALGRLQELAAGHSRKLAEEARVILCPA